MRFTVKHRGQAVTVHFGKCGGEDNRLCLNLPDGSIASVHRRGSRWLLQTIKGDVAKFVPTFPNQHAALHVAATLFAEMDAQMATA